MEKENLIINEEIQPVQEPEGTEKKAPSRVWTLLGGIARRVGSCPYLYLSLTFILPVFIMYLIYLSREIHPFGDGSVLVLDLNGQYVYFFEALRNKVMEGGSMLYSFSRALGGEFMGIYAYYIASPLSYIVCLFPKARILEALLTIFLLKTGICGVTFGYYLHKTSKTLNKYSVVMLSCLYALSAYCVVHQHNTMWIDCVMWLPLVTLGMENLIKYGRFKMFVLFLSLSVWSNFYIGYMVCIYCAVYFFCYYFAVGKENNPLGEKLHFIKSLFRMGVWSMLAIGMALGIILTVYYSLSFGKNDFSNPSYDPASRVDFLDILCKLFPASFDTVRPEGLPFVYCGVITLFMVPVYFLSKKISDKKKIFAGIFIVFLVLSFCFSLADLAWHGFQRPNWLNYRYSFMLIFFLLVLSSRAFEHIDAVPSKLFVGTAAVLSSFLFIIQKLDYEFMEDMETIWLSLAFIGLTLIMLCLMRKGANKETVSAIMVIFICLELFCNGLSNCLDLHDDVYYSSYSSYNNYIKNITPAVERLKEEDTSFYRFEKTHHRKTNDNMALGIRGLSNSTSTLNASTIKLLKQLGYASKSHWSKYLGGTPVTDSLLGIKYVISDKDLSPQYQAQFTEGKYTVYRNPDALSVGFGVNPAIMDFDMEDYDTPFERINELLGAMVGEQVQVFVPVKLSKQSMTNMEESYIASHMMYKAEDPAGSATLIYEFKAPVENTEYYFYLPSDYPREVNLTVNREGNGTFYGNETTRIVSVGSEFAAGDTIRLGMTLAKTELYVKMDIDCLYYIDYDEFNRVLDKLSQVQFNVESYTEDSLSGTVTTTSGQVPLFTTIPYDEGWQVKVDGKEVEIFETIDSLITFPIDEPGEHTVTMEYRPKCYTVGMTSTVICTALFVLLWVLDSVARKKKKSPLPFIGGIVPPKEEENGEDGELASSDQSDIGDTLAEAPDGSLSEADIAPDSADESTVTETAAEEIPTQDDLENQTNGEK